ncbi:MAG: protein Mom, partial [Deinococcota bacterium]
MSLNPKPKLKLAWCSYEAAKYACENWHYSQSVPAGKLVKVGVWEDGKFIGCIIFSRGANNNIGKPYQLKQTEICELTRVALTQHKTPVSKMLAIALRMLR